MLGGLTATIDPILLAEKGARISGRVPVQSMARLRAQLLDDGGEVDVDLSFECMMGSNLRRMHGRVIAHVRLQCQRCLEPTELELVVTPDVILLRHGEPETNLPPEADAFSVGHAPVAVAELIEDELLLALPMVPMHRLEDCPARRFIVGATRGDTGKNPFAELGQAGSAQSSPRKSFKTEKK